MAHAAQSAAITCLDEPRMAADVVAAALLTQWDRTTVHEIVELGRANDPDRMYSAPTNKGSGS
jgi:hypothetical protein